MVLGVETNTLDYEGKVTKFDKEINKFFNHQSLKENIINILEGFKGSQTQIPPDFS